MTYFGTDGIRQKATNFTPDFLARIIHGLAAHSGDHIKLFLAGDTRESTEWILQDLAAACETFGLEYSSAGVLPTPAINYCFYEMGFDFAIDVTASHNPYTDNGIKIFERSPSSGQKLSSDTCSAIETSLAAPDFSYASASPTYHENLHTEALDLYLDHLLDYVNPVDFTDLQIGLDCANGATSVIGATIFEKLGAKVQLIHADTHYNTIINNNCGSTRPESLQQLVLDRHLTCGIAYDGDGDRCIMIDEKGNLVDGDQILALLARYLRLDRLAVTVMANQGLLNWAKNNDIKIEITSVGDSNVATAMRTHSIQLGGEQSGHIILPNEPTGDGILTSLMVVKTLKESDQPLSVLANLFAKSPQVIINLDATPEQKQALKTSDEAKKLLLDYQRQLDACHGRLLVRPSGTEPLIRITLWGDDEQDITDLANNLKSKLSNIL